jgi:hypothetical protein
VELDQDNLTTWLDLPTIDIGRADMTRQALSDILRINLLSEHGGVWVDATCFCCRPLDTWIDDCMGAGFFAFENPGPDRLLASWFLASEPGCPLTLKYRDAVNAFWANHRFAAEHTALQAKAAGFLQWLLNRNAFLTRFWFLPLVSKGLGVYPYFWFHYLLAEVIRRDRQSRIIWDGRHRYSADIPHRLRFAGFFTPVSDTLKSIIDRQEDPLYKVVVEGQSSRRVSRLHPRLPARIDRHDGLPANRVIRFRAGTAVLAAFLAHRPLCRPPIGRRNTAQPQITPMRLPASASNG